MVHDLRHRLWRKSSTWPRARICCKSPNRPESGRCTPFHRAGDETPVSIDGSAVVDSPGWGIVNHSSNVNVTNNVVFNVVGAAYVTEAGDEVGTFDHNIAIKSLGSGQEVSARQNINDFGHDGDGFWFQGGNVTVTNNVAVGQRHAGFVFFPRGLVQGLHPPQTQIPATTCRPRTGPIRRSITGRRCPALEVSGQHGLRGTPPATNHGLLCRTRT